MDAKREAKSNHPASRSAIAATGFRLKPFIIFLDNSSTDLGSLHNLFNRTTRHKGGQHTKENLKLS
jgi:hypothetical protein